HDYNAFLGTGESGDVDVSIDGGTTWETLASFSSDTTGESVLPMPSAAHQPEVQVRFHYTGSWDYWWQVDDVFIGNRTCDPTNEGGYVVGNVSGTDTGEGIVGATATSVDAPEETGTTMAPPDDENLDAGFYWVVRALPGAHVCAAAGRTSEPRARSVDVAADGAARADFELGCGFVEGDPTELTASRTLGDRKPAELTAPSRGSRAAQ